VNEGIKKWGASYKLTLVLTTASGRKARRARNCIVKFNFRDKKVTKRRYEFVAVLFDRKEEMEEWVRKEVL
jgi:hypothetical protein